MLNWISFTPEIRLLEEEEQKADEEEIIIHITIMVRDQVIESAKHLPPHRIWYQLRLLSWKWNLYWHSSNPAINNVIRILGEIVVENCFGIIWIMIATSRSGNFLLIIVQWRRSISIIPLVFVNRLTVLGGCERDGTGMAFKLLRLRSPHPWFILLCKW